MRCESCQGELFKGSGDCWSAWHGLFSAVEVLNSEGTITDRTMEIMIDRLMTLKSLVADKEARDAKV